MLLCIVREIETALLNVKLGESLNHFQPHYTFWNCWSLSLAGKCLDVIPGCDVAEIMLAVVQLKQAVTVLTDSCIWIFFVLSSVRSKCRVYFCLLLLYIARSRHVFHSAIDGKVHGKEGWAGGPQFQCSLTQICIFSHILSILFV